MKDMLIEYLAWNKINGMHNLRMYLIREDEPAQWLQPILDYFAQDGFLSVHEWIVPQVPSHYYGQLGLQYDCTYR